MDLIFLKKAIRKLKGEWVYRIEFPIVGWAENEIAISIHCDARGGTGKNGQYASNRYLRLFFGIKLQRALRIYSADKVFRPHGCVAKSLEYRPLVTQERYKHCFMVSTWREC